MAHSFSLLIALLVVGGTSLILPFQVGSGQTIGEENQTEEMSAVGGNNMSNASAVTGNNTIILNAAEVEEEQYRWVDSSGSENPTLNIVSNDDYIIKISNPTDEEHELVIESISDGEASEIAESGGIEPNSTNVEFNFNTDHVGELGYHCKYHPDMMNGTIKVTESSS